MFTIDLLKKQGLPKKSRPLDAAALTTMMAIAVIMMCLIVVQYFGNSSELAAKHKSLSYLELKIDQPIADKMQSNLTNDMDVFNKAYSEVANSICRYVQWTPVLREFSETLTPTMLVNELSVLRSVKKEKVTSVKDPKKKVDYEIITRTLKSDIYDFVADSDDAEVKEYLTKLRGCDWLENVYLSQSSDLVFEDRKIKNYIINALLKLQGTVGK